MSCLSSRARAAQESYLGHPPLGCERDCAPAAAALARTAISNVPILGRPTRVILSVCVCIRPFPHIFSQAYMSRKSETFSTEMVGDASVRATRKEHLRCDYVV